MGRGGWWLGYLLKPWCFYYLVGCLDGCKLAGVFRLCEQIPRYTHPLYEYRISSKRTKVSIFHTHIQNLSDTPPKFSQVTEVMNNQIPRRLWWLSYQSSQIIMFHQPRFPRTKVMSLPKSYLFGGARPGLQWRLHQGNPCCCPAKCPDHITLRIDVICWTSSNRWFTWHLVNKFQKLGDFFQDWEGVEHLLETPIKLQ